MSYLEQVDKTRVPRHVAIIMDGNGRWATSQGMDRTMGHQAGAQKSHEIMETAVKLGLDYLTLYTFSTENWNRPLEEIAALMSLLLKHLEEELFMKYDARFTVVGDIQRLPENVQGDGGASKRLKRHCQRSMRGGFRPCWWKAEERRYRHSSTRMFGMKHTWKQVNFRGQK